jgi:fused signal recognition particle receptor
MTGFNAVQGVVILFGVIFAILIAVMVIGYRRGKAKEQSEVKDNAHREIIPISVEPLITSKDPGVEESGIEQPRVAPTKGLEAQIDTKVAAKPEFEESTPLEKALAGTKQRFWGRLNSLWSGSAVAGIDEIEEVLYTSDLGPQTVELLLESIKQSLSRSEKKDPEVVRTALREEILSIFEKTQGIEEPQALFEKFHFHQPSVWMVVGVNGAGKTTSIGKIASQLAQSGKKVLLAAGDTFRAAAGNQLKVWTERAQVEIFSPDGVTDPSAVAFDAVQKGVAKGYDVIIVDTAGRLHTQQNLMEEIKKMKRVVQKVLPEAPHEVLLVLDSNQGQNALLQAKEFHKALGVTGVVLTKLDGSAKGGVAVGVAHELELPIKLIGVGEKMGDLRPFSAKSFVESIL